MRIEDQKPENDPLDALLAKARWPQASAESMRRLEESWKDQWSARPLRANWLWPMATAAAILVGLGSVAVLVLLPPNTTPIVQGPILINPYPKNPIQPVMIESRPPTMRERLIVGDMRPEKPLATVAPAMKQESAPRDPQTLVSLISNEQGVRQQRDLMAELLRCNNRFAVGLYLQLVVDPRHRAVALDALADIKEPPVQELIDELGNPRVSVRFAAARALGRIDGPVTTEQLVALVKRNTQRREALAALLYSDGVDASAFLADARRMPGLSSTLRAVEIQLKTVQ
jgi:hypothetical protein